MARSLYLYAFSAATWRAHVGSREAATSALLGARVSQTYGDDENCRTALATLVAQVVGGTFDGSAEESWPHTWLARELVVLGQQPSPAPELDLFWHNLSQTCLGGGAVQTETGEKPTASNREERRVVRWLKEGRPLFGDHFGPGFAGRSPLSDIYGWLDAEDVPSLVAVVSSPSWAEFPIQARYRKKWKAQVAGADEWVKGVAKAGADVFFSSEPLAAGA